MLLSLVDEETEVMREVQEHRSCPSSDGWSGGAGTQTHVYLATESELPEK